MRLWGVTEKGNSVQCNVNGYTASFTAILPDEFHDIDCQDFEVTLEVRRKKEQEKEESDLIYQSIIRKRLLRKII